MSFDSKGITTLGRSPLELMGELIIVVVVAVVMSGVGCLSALRSMARGVFQ